LPEARTPENEKPGRADDANRAKADGMDPSYNGRPAPSITSRHEYPLAELRCATLRARLWQADIEAVGLALKGALITPEQALELLHDCDVLRLVGPSHEADQ
jgi:hypothetical protein